MLLFFGMRDLRRIVTGPEYARRLNTLVRRTSMEIHTDSTVIDINPGESGKRHSINVASPNGLHTYNCRAILLATGCSIQLDHSIVKPVIEAWSVDRMIWRNSYHRLIANHRIPIPLWEFDLKNVDERSGVILKLHGTH